MVCVAETVVCATWMRMIEQDRSTARAHGKEWLISHSLSLAY